MVGRGKSLEMYLEDNLGKKGVGGSLRKSVAVGGIGCFLWEEEISLDWGDKIGDIQADKTVG